MLKYVARCEVKHKSLVSYMYSEGLLIRGVAIDRFATLKLLDRTIIILKLSRHK